ncbi:MAG: aminotransferase class IV [Planctomycetes bacterium]|nr:aminotransferase class IV [Planctomycetota bacterium]
MIVWLDGAFLPEEQALVPATDRAFLHGRGLFETLRAYRGIPFRIADHLSRMKASADRFGIPFKTADFDSAIRKLCRRNQVDDAAVRLTLSAEGRRLITVRPRKPLPPAWYRKGAKVTLVPWRRDPRTLLAGHKVTSVLENVLVHEDARKRGFAEALYVGLEGELLEGSVSNLFLVVKGRLVTPKLKGILPGVTRQVVMELAAVKERTLRLEELRTADEAFLTNALIEVLPIGRPGPVGRKIAEDYRALTRSLR